MAKKKRVERLKEVPSGYWGDSGSGFEHWGKDKWRNPETGRVAIGSAAEMLRDEYWRKKEEAAKPYAVRGAKAIVRSANKAIDSIGDRLSRVPGSVKTFIKENPGKVTAALAAVGGLAALKGAKGVKALMRKVVAAKRKAEQAKAMATNSGKAVRSAGGARSLLAKARDAMAGAKSGWRG